MKPVRLLTRWFSKTFYPVGVYAEVAVLEHFIERPNERHYVLDNIIGTRVHSGDCYVLLAKLERWGWLESGVEIVSERRWYFLTDYGLRKAWQSYLNKCASLELEILGGAR
jgi:Transcriptional regulator PadR-like family